MHDPKQPAGPEALVAPTRRNLMLADGLPLERVYVRFDAIARGRPQDDSSAAPRSVIDRLAANRRCAKALGWTDFVLERAGGGLHLTGASGPGRDRETVPDAIPSGVSEPANDTTSGRRLPPRPARRVDAAPAKGRSLARMRWNDDGGR